MAMPIDLRARRRLPEFDSTLNKAGTRLGEAPVEPLPSRTHPFQNRLRQKASPMVVIAILGLLVPGYCAARALRAPAAWAVAFPFSAMLIAETVIAFAIVGVPIRFNYALAVLAAASVIGCAVIVWRTGTPSNAPRKGAPDVGDSEASAEERPAIRLFAWLPVTVAVVCLAILLGMAVRTSLRPLSGYDTVFRWEGLARLMLDQENLSFYPPVTPDDFTKYIYPDGIPPLVAPVYWWLYAGWGTPWPALTSVAVVLQAVSCLALVFYAARTLFGFTGGAVALAALVTSPLFLSGVAIGQETGYTALSYAGQLAFALLAIREPKASSVAIAGVFAGMGALAREYGPLLSLAGIAVLACTRESRRRLPLFYVVAAACASPWYARNWFLTGNPLYSIDLGLGFPVNRVHDELMTTYRGLFGLTHWSTADWGRNLAQVAAGAPLAIVAGVAGMAIAGRKAFPLGLAALVAILLWLWSVRYTSADVEYTLRVLTPAWVALSVAAGAVGPMLDRCAGARGRLLRGGAILAVVLCGAYAALSAWSHPLGPRELPAAIRQMTKDPLDWYAAQRAIARALEGTTIPPVGVLTDDCYLATALKRETRFRPVMIWNPGIAFVFDEKLDPAEVRRRLCGMGIRIVASSGGPNAVYVQKFPFYRDDPANWQPVIEMPGVWTVFFLPTSAP